MSAAGRSLRLGTRGSLLAMAQSRLVANALMEKTPELAVELVTFRTRGDRNQSIPLSDVRDTGFFSAELDTALINGEVDACVHSLKDLGPKRPPSIIRGAIPHRENPRDVIVFRADVIERLKRGQPIRIGSSSARRQNSVASFLRDALPDFGSEPEIEFLPVRGAVNDRLARVQRHEDKGDALDGVILAIAGLSRLWEDPDGRREIEPLLSDVRWMVLPLSRCPTAPGQGALAVECRSSDVQTRELLRTIHDPDSAALVQKELDTLIAIPESERSAIGATALTQKKMGTLMYVGGRKSRGGYVDWHRPPPPGESRPWDGGNLQSLLKSNSLPLVSGVEVPSAMFVAHWHAVTRTVSILEDTRVWVSGVHSWRELARQGIWVEGCADNLGFADILPTLGCGVLRLPPVRCWLALTHRDAISSWRKTGIGHVQATYSLDPVADFDEWSDLRQTITEATHFFWGSSDQYQRVKKWVPENAQHACGAGKTAQALEEIGVPSLQLFPSRKEWQAWLR